MSANFSFADYKVPRLSLTCYHLYSQAGMLPRSQEQKLSHALRQLYKNGGSQIQVLTVKDLGGVTIEQASIQTVDQWKLGSAEKDNGVSIACCQKRTKDKN